MATSIRISDDLMKIARKYGMIEHRSLTGQIEHWASIGRIAEGNPDLSYGIIRDILSGLQELSEEEKSEYTMG